MILELAARLTEVLAAPPSPVLPAGSIAPRRPGAAGDLPALAISVAVDRADELGFGRLVRGGELLQDDRVRQDTRGDRLAGTVTFEAWADEARETGDLSRALDGKLRAVAADLQVRGFRMLRPAALDAMESLRIESGGGPAFGAWRQRMAYRFVFELVEGGELTGAGTIRRVDVDVADYAESFSAPPE